MVRYTVGSHEVNKVVQTTFENFAALLRGRSIVGFGEPHPQQLEIKLSGDLMLLIGSPTYDVEVNCFSTQNPQEPIAFTLLLGDMGRGTSVFDIEAKLRGLRTLFAIFYLLETQRGKELLIYLAHHPFGDIDCALLANDEHLQIESVSLGSWIATVRAKTKGAAQALTALATIVFPRVRDMFLRKMEAETALKETETARGAVALERERFELAKARADYVLDLAKRVGEGEAQEILNRRLRAAIYDLASGDPNESEIRGNIRRMLPPQKVEDTSVGTEHLE